MEVYLQAFVNFKQNNWARFLPMDKFAYNNAKNLSTSHMPFELNCCYHFRMLYEEEFDPRSKSNSMDKISVEQRKLMIVCQENLYFAQEVQKWAHNKGIKPKSYALNEKVWSNSTYIKTKWQQNLEAKFFRPFQVLHLIGK